MKPDYTLYLATDRGMLEGRDVVAVIEDALRGGVTAVQLREKEADARGIYAVGCALLPVTRRFGVPLIINDRVDVMLALDADGVHVGPKDLPLERVRAIAQGKIVGYSANTPEDALYASRAGADYVGVGPIFETATKSDTRSTLGINGLRDVVTRSPIPCVAIGGISAEGATAVYATGVAGVCAISGILRSTDPEARARLFRQAAGR